MSSAVIDRRYNYSLGTVVHDTWVGSLFRPDVE